MSSHCLNCFRELPGEQNGICGDCVLQSQSWPLLYRGPTIKQMRLRAEAAEKQLAEAQKAAAWLMNQWEGTRPGESTAGIYDAFTRLAAVLKGGVMKYIARGAFPGRAQWLIGMHNLVDHDGRDVAKMERDYENEIGKIPRYRVWCPECGKGEGDAE